MFKPIAGEDPARGHTICNLYRLTSTSAEVAHLFGARLADGNAGEEVYPGYPGWVLACGTLRTMNWGFPLSLKGEHGQPLKPRPVNNARSDKLLSTFWRASFTERRCLIPLSAFAEAEGQRGHKTRTWVSVPGEPVFTCAGIWRDSAEWGPVYAMVITEPSRQMREVHDRMPVIISAGERELWLSGEPRGGFDLCRPYASELTIERTDQPWVARR